MNEAKLNKNIKIIIYGLLITLMLASLLYTILVSGENSTNLFFYDKAWNPNGDTFMDFYNPINHAIHARPYIRVDRIYPALPYVFYFLLSKFIPIDTVLSGGDAIRVSINGQMLLLLYTMITTSILILTMWKLYKVRDKEKGLGIFLILFSAPFIFQFERANIILISLIFVLLFLLLKDSERKLYRELALICLAISACIKIYPAIFGLLLLKDRRFKDAFRCIIYGILLFVVPFLFMGGLDTIPIMVDSLTKGAQNTLSLKKGFGYKVNISNVVAIIFGLNGQFSQSIINFGNIISYILLAISIVSAFFIQSKWKTVAILCALVAAIPSFSFVYSLVFMSIPLMMFLNNTEKRTKLDYVYAFLFVGIFGLIVFGQCDFLAKLGGKLLLNLSTFIEGISLTCLLLILNIEGLIDMVRTLKNKWIKERI